MKALVIGAESSRGAYMVYELLEDKDYESVTAFVRNTIGITHPKFIEFVTDFSDIETSIYLMDLNVVFFCSSIVLRQAGEKIRNHEISHQAAAAIARAAKESKVHSFVLLSTCRASRRSFFFHRRIKAEFEKAVWRLDFEQLAVFRPGIGG